MQFPCHPQVRPQVHCPWEKGITAYKCCLKTNTPVGNNGDGGMVRYDYISKEYIQSKVAVTVRISVFQAARS